MSHCALSGRAACAVIHAYECLRATLGGRLNGSPFGPSCVTVIWRSYGQRRLSGADCRPSRFGGLATNLLGNSPLLRLLSFKYLAWICHYRFGLQRRFERLRYLVVIHPGSGLGDYQQVEPTCLAELLTLHEWVDSRLNLFHWSLLAGLVNRLKITVAADYATVKVTSSHIVWWIRYQSIIQSASSPINTGISRASQT
jgi:hypothetical protein